MYSTCRYLSVMPEVGLGCKLSVSADLLSQAATGRLLSFRDYFDRLKNPRKTQKSQKFRLHSGGGSAIQSYKYHFFNASLWIELTAFFTVQLCGAKSIKSHKGRLQN